LPRDAEEGVFNVDGMMSIVFSGATVELVQVADAEAK